MGPWLWVPTQTDLRRAERTYGPAPWSDRARHSRSPHPARLLWTPVSEARQRGLATPPHRLRRPRTRP
jgi:hypothetical protein